MGSPTPHEPVLRIVAIITRHEQALEWAIGHMTSKWGGVALESETFAFEETRYYEPTMGSHLGKTFLAFERLADPAELADWKWMTNAWEDEYAASAGHAEPRPLNLDPGYITPAKLVLASTKDHAHRIYLRDGMYAEVTLFYRHGAWQHHEFTFPDYRRGDYQQFFTRCRQWLRQKSASGEA